MLARRRYRPLLPSILTLAAVGIWVIPYMVGRAENHSNDDLRPNLKLCVENFDGTPTSPATLGTLIAAFKAVELHPHFKAARLDRGQGPTFVAGCPGDATIKSPEWFPKYGDPNVVTIPSDISTFIFVVPAEEAQQAFGTTFPRLTSQEMLCEEDVCGEVTTALYLTPEELLNVELLARSLSWGIGLIPVGEKLPTDITPPTSTVAPERPYPSP